MWALFDCDCLCKMNLFILEHRRVSDKQADRWWVGSQIWMTPMEHISHVVLHADALNSSVQIMRSNRETSGVTVESVEDIMESFEEEVRTTHSLPHTLISNSCVLVGNHTGCEYSHRRVVFDRLAHESGRRKCAGRRTRGSHAVRCPQWISDNSTSGRAVPSSSNYYQRRCHFKTRWIIEAVNGGSGGSVRL